jgi:hypothetical protein
MGEYDVVGPGRYGQVEQLVGADFKFGVVDVLQALG